MARWIWQFRLAPIRGARSASSEAGDLLATVRIMLPDRTDDEFKELMRKWRESKPYDPREDME